MLKDASFTVADNDFYEPLASAHPGRRYVPSGLGAGWTEHTADVWTHWTPGAVDHPQQGWKVHVSSSLANADAVLDVVAGACAQLNVPFKHLTGRRFFLWLHSKHGSRVQSGKFCTLYPPTPQVAHEVLERLGRDLAGVAGPYVLTDRRYGDSQCVSYRYGAFRARHDLQADGTERPTMLSLSGAEVPDERRAEFLLPEGVQDPFAPPPLQPTGDDPVSFHGYTFDAVLRHTNSGGVYRAHTADGREVVIKEARAHNGYAGEQDAKTRLEHEYLALRAVHARVPGLCPEPIEFFTEWEHTYLVTELVPGRTLVKWTVATTPVIHAGESPEVFADYYRRCRAILDRLGAQLAALHELGYAFIDVGPGNVLIDDDDTVRLVDFEATQRVDHPPGVLGTPGFEPPELRAPGARAGIDPRYVDAYGLAAIAQLLVFPINEVVQRSPETLDHLHADLADLAPVPTELWHAATRFRPETASRRLPTPDSVRESPREALRHLRDRTAEALQSMADPTHPRRVYPTIPDGHASNTRCVAYGTAGVLHALSLAGREVDPAVVARLRDDSLRNRRKTPPGLLFGNAGIAWVLADLGEHDAAATLLAEATEHRLTRTAAGWGGGAAGVAMTHLSFYCRTGDPSHLDQARRLLDALPHGDALIPLLGADNASGLVHGRPGVALALYYLAALTGAPEPFERGIRLLREELAHAEPMPVDALGFRVSDSDRRNMPYLACGAAGYVHVLARYLTRRPDPELARTLRRCLRTVSIRFTTASGLFYGQSGLALAHAEVAAALPEHDPVGYDPTRLTALFKHAVPHPSGVRWPGSHGSRLSADLWTGSAGVLVALEQALTGTPDPLFTLDRYVNDLPASGYVREEGSENNAGDPAAPVGARS